MNVFEKSTRGNIQEPKGPNKCLKHIVTLFSGMIMDKLNRDLNHMCLLISNTISHIAKKQNINILKLL